jgi:GTPase SAR1 family protein
MGNQPSGESHSSQPNPTNVSQKNPTSPRNSDIPPAQALKLNPSGQTNCFYSQRSSASLKVLIRGGPGAGKTALFNALQGFPFTPEYNPTEQLQYSKVVWSPHSAVNALASAQFLQRSGTTGLQETTQFKINPQIETDVGVSIELVDVIDNGHRQLIPANKLPNKNSLPPNIDLIDGHYYLPPVDSTTVDVWKNASVLLLCIDPYSLPTYHYAVNILNHLPPELVTQGFSIVLCLLKRDLPPIDRAVNDHMINMLTNGTFIKVLHLSAQNGYGLDKLRNSLLIPFLMNRSNEYQRLSEIYKQEAQLVNTYMTQLISGDGDYYKYVRVDQFNKDDVNGLGGGIGVGVGTVPKTMYDDDLSQPRRLDNDLDDFIGGKNKGGIAKTRFGDIDIDIDDDDHIGKKNVPKKAQLKNKEIREKELIIANTQQVKGNNNNNNNNNKGSLDDFFGGSSFGNDDNDDLIVPIEKKPKKKPKKTTKTIAENDEPVIAVPTKQKSSTTPSFFDDDLDLEPIAPVKKKPLSTTQRAVQQTSKINSKTTTTSSQPSANGFFDNVADEPISVGLLRPSSSHNIDEEAELAFFDGDDDDNDDIDAQNDTSMIDLNHDDTKISTELNLDNINHDNIQVNDGGDGGDGGDDCDDDDGDVFEFNNDGDDNTVQNIQNEDIIQDVEEETGLVPETHNDQVDIVADNDDNNAPNGSKEVTENGNEVVDDNPEDVVIETVVDGVQVVRNESEKRDDLEQDDDDDDDVDVIATPTEDVKFEPEVPQDPQHSQEREPKEEQQAAPIPVDEPIKDVVEAVQTPVVIPVIKPNCFFDDDDDNDDDDNGFAPPPKKQTPKTTPKPATPVTPAPVSPSLAPVNDLDDFFSQPSVKTPVITAVKQTSPTSNNFFDDDDEDVIIAPSTKKVGEKSPTVQNSPVVQSSPTTTTTKSQGKVTSPMGSAFDDFDDDDVVATRKPAGKKKVVSKKQSALEKQMADLKEEQRKKDEQNTEQFSFRAGKSSSFYE